MTTAQAIQLLLSLGGGLFTLGNTGILVSLFYRIGKFVQSHEDLIRRVEALEKKKCMAEDCPIAD